MPKVDNAIIIAAGTSSRFAPLSYEKPKGLIEVKGEILIERQITQLLEAGIPEIYIVIGYLGEQFLYLSEKYGVHIVWNLDYLTRNNNASIYAVKDVLHNSYICSADNYFTKNPFERDVADCYYAAVYADGETKEWCMQYGEDDVIRSVTIGGRDSWYMLGHTFWDETFSRQFIRILEETYDAPETAQLLWESIYIQHISELHMKIRKYDPDTVFEFDTLDELREFDRSYVSDTRSGIIKSIVKELGCEEDALSQFTMYKDSSNAAAGFTFLYNGMPYTYSYQEKNIKKR